MLLKNGNYSDKLYQMTSKCVIQRETIATGYGEKILKCPVCGKEKFGISSSYQLHLNKFDTISNNDFIITERVFGEDVPYSLHIVSQRFYRLLKQHKLARNVNFEPVAFVSQ